MEARRKEAESFKRKREDTTHVSISETHKNQVIQNYNRRSRGGCEVRRSFFRYVGTGAECAEYSH